MRSKKALILVFILILSCLTACTKKSNNDVESTIKTVVKEVVCGNEVEEHNYKKAFNNYGYESLTNKLSDINSEKLENLSVACYFTSSEYNSLNKDFYEAVVMGTKDKKIYTIDLFLCTDCNGLVENVLIWDVSVK